MTTEMKQTTVDENKIIEAMRNAIMLFEQREPVKRVESITFTYTDQGLIEYNIVFKSLASPTLPTAQQLT